MSDTVSREEWAALNATLDRVTTTADELRGYIRTQSKADLIGTASAPTGSRKAGQFLGAILAQRGNDPEAYVQSKALLSELGAGWMDVPAQSKATLGDTAAAGGWIVPNALVEEITKAARRRTTILDLVTEVSDVTAFQIDLPVRPAAPARMTIQYPRGSTKENVDLTYGGYTATMYTIARIHDVANQFLRQSLGAAERDVLGELSDAANRAKEYYILSGTGSNQPYGLVPALDYDTTFDVSGFSPSATTLAGSMVAAITHAAADLAEREVFPTAALINAGTYWTMLRQGTDTAGFFFNGRDGAVVEGVRPGTLVSPFGIPVIPSNEVATDDLIVGDFSALKYYTSGALRIDSSSTAGSRWDENETGFRGEQEIALDARAATQAGYFAIVRDITP